VFINEAVTNPERRVEPTSVVLGRVGGIECFGVRPHVTGGEIQRQIVRQTVFGVQIRGVLDGIIRFEADFRFAEPKFVERLETVGGADDKLVLHRQPRRLLGARRGEADAAENGQRYRLQLSVSRAFQLTNG